MLRMYYKRWNVTFEYVFEKIINWLYGRLGLVEQLPNKFYDGCIHRLVSVKQLVNIDSSTVLNKNCSYFFIQNSILHIPHTKTEKYSNVEVNKNLKLISLSYIFLFWQFFEVLYLQKFLTKVSILNK